MYDRQSATSDWIMYKFIDMIVDALIQCVSAGQLCRPPPLRPDSTVQLRHCQAPPSNSAHSASNLIYTEVDTLNDVRDRSG